MGACASGAGEDGSLSIGSVPVGLAVSSTTSGAPDTSAASATPALPSSAGAVDAGGGDVVDDEVREAALAVQHGYLSDGELTSEEYEAAFNAFMVCANDGGARVEIRRVDPELGQILYSTWNEGKEIADECYWRHFADVDRWFQTTNPVLLAQEAERNRERWQTSVLPCLTRFGVEVPAHLDGTELTRDNPEALPFHRQYQEHLLAGTCE